MKKYIRMLLAAASVGAITLPAVKAAEAVVITGVNLVPMTSETILPDQTVVITAGRITAICPSQERCQPKDGKIIDGKGKFLIPGLADMHVHIDGLDLPHVPALGERIQGQMLQQYLSFGVTTLRNASGSARTLSARDAINSGKREGPRIFTAAAAMDGDPPLHGGSRPFSSPAAAAAYVRETKQKGFDTVKIYSTLPTATFDAITDAAREAGLPVMGHLPVLVDFEHALTAGQRSIEHLSGFDMACAGPDAGLQPTMPDIYQGWAWCTPEKIRALALTVKKHGAWVTPTLMVADEVANEYDRYASIDEAARHYANPVALQFNDYMFEIFPPRSRAGLAGTRSTRRGIVKILAEENVPLLIGTDTVSAGFNVHREMALFVEAGLTPYQALMAATSEPARYFDRAGQFGTIVVGAEADLLLLAANPLADISNTRKIEGVMFRGNWWDKGRIEAVRAELQKQYAADAKLSAAPVKSESAH